MPQGPDARVSAGWGYAHTNMSTMDALPEVELIAKAAEWGHKAGGYREASGNVQSFPHGFKAAKESWNPADARMEANINEGAKVPHL